MRRSFVFVLLLPLLVCAHFDSQGSPLGYLLLPQGGIAGGGGSSSASGGGSAGGSSGTWWNTAWSRRRAIPFDNSSRTEDLLNVPVLIKLDATRIDYSLMQSAGQDLCFVDADDATQLDHEIESWNAAGTSYVWVRVPQIDGSSATDSIYMYYGSSSSCAENASGVWNADYTAVWHLDENPAGFYEFESNAVATNYPDIINITANIYAVVYHATSPSSEGWLKTIQMQTDGSGGATLDSFMFETPTAEYVKILNVSGNVYALAYIAAGGGTVKTIEINSDGSIGAVLDTQVFDASATAVELDFIHVSGDTFAVTHQGAAGDGFITSVGIASTGVITTGLGQLEFDTADAASSSITQVSGTTYAVTYAGTGNIGIIKTIQINANGTYGGVLDQLTFDATQGVNSDVFNVSGDIFAVVYSGAGNDGWLRTIDIATNGTINGLVSFLEWDPGTGQFPRVTPVASGIYAIAYRGGGGDGWTMTLSINTAGTAVNYIDNFEYQPSRGNEPVITNLSGDWFMIACGCNAGTPGRAHVFKISATGDYYGSEDSTTNARTTESYDLFQTDLVTGQIATAHDYNIGRKRDVVENEPALSGGAFTASMWINPDSLTANRTFFGATNNGTNAYAFRQSTTLAGALEFYSGSANYMTPGAVLTAGAWQHVAVTYDGSEYKLYRNGALEFTSAAAQAAVTDRNNLGLGGYDANNNGFAGSMDETRISTAARSADWLSAQYASQNDTFASFSAEETQ